MTTGFTRPRGSKSDSLTFPHGATSTISGGLFSRFVTVFGAKEKAIDG